MNIVILEDELLAAEKLERIIKQIVPGVKVLASLDSVTGAVEWFNINPHRIDIFFMDIHLADGHCFSIFEKIKLSMPVIFITAYDQYAIQAFRVNSIDYLLKPVTQKDLERSFEKYYAVQLARENPQVDYTHLAGVLQSGQKIYKQRFLVKQGNSLITIPVEQAQAFFADGRYVFLVSEAHKKYIINFTLDELEEILDPSLFYRVNRQQILHINSIGQIVPYFKGRLKLIVPFLPGVEIIVSSEKSPLFKKWLER